MSEKMRVVIEIRNAVVSDVYASGSVEVVVIDNDLVRIEKPITPLPESAFFAQDYAVYDGRYPKHWPQVPYHTPAKSSTPAMREVVRAGAYLDQVRARTETALALRTGHTLSGAEIADKALRNMGESSLVASIPEEYRKAFRDGWNAALEEAAQEIERIRDYLNTREQAKAELRQEQATHIRSLKEDL